MGRTFRPYIIDAQAAAEHLGIDLPSLYRYCRNGQIEGETDDAKHLSFDRRKLALNMRAPGRPRIHEPESGRTQVTHSPAELRAWLARAKAEGCASLAQWIRKAANHRAGVK